MTRYVVKSFDRTLFPALYRCADDAALSGQKWYVRWMTINLSLLFVGALVGSIGLTDVSSKQVANTITAIIFFGAVGVTILLATRRWESVWYAGRAVAESAKSLTWKFICAADPFPSSMPYPDAVELFTKSLNELLYENKQLAPMLAGPDATGDQVTSYMSDLREAATGVKRDAYWSQRVLEQQQWYAQKSADNRKKRNIWFVLLVVFQVAAGVAAVLLAVHPTYAWKASAMFSTLASATVAWGSMKRYQELAQSYGLAAQELSLIAARAPHIGTEVELARFVNDAETAISREHAMWVARRETQ
jgi:hypothetical protein